MPSRIRDLQLEAASEQDFERRNRQRAEAEAMLAEEEVSAGIRPGPMVAPPKGVPAERGGAGPRPLGDARLSAPPKLGAAERNAITTQGAVGPALQRGLQAVGNFAGSVGAAAAEVVKPGRMQELAKPAADGMEQLGQTMESAEGRAVADEVEDSSDRRERRKQMGKISDEERAAAEAQFNKLWEADDGAIRTTYTTEDGRPDFQSFLNDMVAPGEDPRTALGRVMQNIAGRDGGTDSAGRKVAGYTTPVTPVAPPSADEAEKQSRAAKPFVPGASRLPRGVTRPNAFSADPSGGENGQGQNRIRVGMAAHTNAHELAGDEGHDMEGAGGGFPTTMDKWAEMFRQNNNPDDERAYVLMFAQQNGFDFTGVPEEDQYNAAKRMTAETLFRYGDAEQKKWAKGWGKLQGDRWHISMKVNPATGKRDMPIAEQPMRTAAWDPTTGTFVESATDYARGQTDRLRNISAMRDKVGRRATLGPDKQMSEEQIAAEMGADWNTLTPDQQRQFTGEMERGARVFRNNVNSAQVAEIRAGTDRARGRYNDEMAQARTPLDSFKVAMKYGDPQAAEAYAQMIAGDQEIAAAEVSRRGEPSAAEQITGAAGVRKDVTTAVAAGGSPAAAKAVIDPEGLNPTGTNREIAQGVVSSWRDSGQLDGMSPADVVNHPGLRDYLRDNVDGGAMFRGDEDWALPSWMGGLGISGNNTLSLKFAQSVIADLGLPQAPEYAQALADWWRSQPEVDDPAATQPQGAPAQAPPASTPATSTATANNAMWSW
jgi:hypothetical protein